MRPRVVRSAGIYVLLVGLPVLVLLWVLRQSPTPPAAVATPAGVTGGATFLPNMVTLVVQLIVILGAARAIGWLFRRIHQPQVVGEMTAGILLGPSLFGAFLAGVIIPRQHGLHSQITSRFEDVTVVFLLPLFFAFTGLRTSLGLVHGELLGVLLLVIAAAIAGKLGASAVAARATGMPWRESLAVGTLMNTRGLMELVILNIGLDIGVISPPLFSVFVVMTLVTTFMTMPLLRALRLPTER